MQRHCFPCGCQANSPRRAFVSRRGKDVTDGVWSGPLSSPPMSVLNRDQTRHPRPASRHSCQICSAERRYKYQAEGSDSSMTQVSERLPNGLYSAFSPACCDMRPFFMFRAVVSPALRNKEFGDFFSFRNGFMRSCPRLDRRHCH